MNTYIYLQIGNREAKFKSSDDMKNLGRLAEIKHARR